MENITKPHVAARNDQSPFLQGALITSRGELLYDLTLYLHIYTFEVFELMTKKDIFLTCNNLKLALRWPNITKKGTDESITINICKISILSNWINASSFLQKF